MACKVLGVLGVGSGLCRVWAVQGVGCAGCGLCRVCACVFWARVCVLGVIIRGPITPERGEARLHVELCDGCRRERIGPLADPLLPRAIPSVPLVLGHLLDPIEHIPLLGTPARLLPPKPSDSCANREEQLGG